MRSAATAAAATPALDRLAAEGVRFDFAHAHAVVTLPSHASILTGTVSRSSTASATTAATGWRPNARTAATLLKQAGYATAAFVGAFPVHSRFGLNQGFDVYDDRFGETRAPTEFVMPERPAAGSSRSLAMDRGTRGRRAGRVGQVGQERAAPARARRWFVWVHLFDPHAPYRPPPPFDAQYRGRPY